MTSDSQRINHLREHPLRAELANEVHARPFEHLNAPLQATHVALWHDGDAAEQEYACLARLCQRYGANPPTPDKKHFSEDFGTFRLKWERHTEFSSYTFFVHAPFQEPFASPPIEKVPADWLTSLPGQLLVGIHLVIEGRDQPARDFEALAVLFASNTVTGAAVGGGAAEVWTDFRIHADGFGRILIRDQGLRSRQAGRLAQRLFEIETYRTAALLGLPAARQYTLDLAVIDRRLAEITHQITAISDLEDERRLLEQLSELSANIEHASSATSYRFSASRAYYDLVCRRIEDLREQRMPGLQTFNEFMQRRLSPAMQTCASIQAWIEQLATRVGRASELLRTRVDITLEAQNRDLLASMDRRAKTQLLLQETVEGLSVVVLSYYLVSLVSYVLKAIKSAGLYFNTELATGIAIPFVVGTVFLGIRRLKRSVLNETNR